MEGVSSPIGEHAGTRGNVGIPIIGNLTCGTHGNVEPLVIGDWTCGYPRGGAGICARV